MRHAVNTQQPKVGARSCNSSPKLWYTVLVVAVPPHYYCYAHQLLFTVVLVVSGIWKQLYYELLALFFGFSRKNFWTSCMSHGQLLLALRRGQLQSGLWWWTIWSYTTTSIIVLALSLMLFDLLLTTIFATIYVALHTHQIRIYTRTLIKQEWKCWGAMGFYLNSVQRIHECLLMHACRCSV